MAGLFGRGKVVDAEELQHNLQERQTALMARLEEIESSKKGGGGRFFLGLLFGGALAGAAVYLSDAERRQTVMGAAGSLTGGGADESVERDQAVTSRVEAALFSNGSTPKDQININTVDGVVYVRGTIGTKEQIDEIERRVKGVEGVDAVINLLRLPAPAK
ncbi:MAG TPA: BON domain-containing protein [Thermomicrobiales bacterium]|jgi:hypothetical protein